MGKHDQYPEEVAAFIREHSTNYSIKGLTEEIKIRYGFEKTPSAVRSYLRNHKLHSMPRKGRELPEKSKYPVEMREYIRGIAWGRSYKEIMQLVNDRFGDGTISLRNLHTYLKNHKIKTGRTGYFKKGMVPWTKGKTRDQIVKDPEKRKHSEATQFKKGNVSANWIPVGTVVKNRDGYLMRKRQNEGTQWERWELLHRAIWEEHNGPIPEGMKISFKDGNKENCDIENLMIVTKGEHVLLTTLKLRSEDPDLTEAGLQVVRIIQQCKELEKARK